MKTLKQWGARYRGFAMKRFDIFSKGGGDWAPLKPATIARRRKGKGTGAIAILRDTSTLFRALNPILGQPGQLEQYPGTFTVELGFGGNQAHPNSKATIADIAAFHNFGMGNNPKRQIIVVPDAHTLEQMSKDAERNLSADAQKKTTGH
jgi:hypothetical protein